MFCDCLHLIRFQYNIYIYIYIYIHIYGMVMHHDQCLVVSTFEHINDWWICHDIDIVHLKKNHISFLLVLCPLKVDYAFFGGGEVNWQALTIVPS
jgi:hypothetical protein